MILLDINDFTDNISDGDIINFKLINIYKNYNSLDIPFLPTNIPLNYQIEKTAKVIQTPLVIPCLDEVAYKEDGNCDGIVATAVTTSKKNPFSNNIYSDECTVTNHKLVNWSIIDKFKEKKIACSLIHIIPFIYYIASTDCNIVTINTRLDDQQFFKQTNIRKGFEAFKGALNSLKKSFSSLSSSKKPAEVQPTAK